MHQTSKLVRHATTWKSVLWVERHRGTKRRKDITRWMNGTENLPMIKRLRCRDKRQINQISISKLVEAKKVYRLWKGFNKNWEVISRMALTKSLLVTEARSCWRLIYRPEAVASPGESRRQLAIDNVDIFGETRNDATNRCLIEKRHRTLQDASQHDLVEADGGLQARDRRHHVNYDGEKCWNVILMTWNLFMARKGFATRRVRETGGFN